MKTIKEKKHDFFYLTAMLNPGSGEPRGGHFWSWGATALQVSNVLLPQQLNGMTGW